MADLTEFQRDVVEAVAAREDAPTALLQYVDDNPAVYMQAGEANGNEKFAHIDLLATYVAHLEEQTGESRDDLLESAKTRLESWEEEGMGVESESRS